MSDGQGSYIAQMGQIVFCNPKWIHWGRAADVGGWGINTVYIPLHTLMALQNRAGRTGHEEFSFNRIVVDDPALSKLVNRAVRLRDTMTDPCCIEQALTDVAIHSVRHHANSAAFSLNRDRESVAIKRAREFIEQHCLDPISLNDLAEEAALDKYWLIKSFRKHLGVTPHAYLVINRIEKSKELMRAGLRLPDVAVECGFSDQSHFSRAFKRSTGVTPGRFACF